MTFDGKAFGKDVVETTKAYIDKTIAPLLAEIASLKAEVVTLKAAPAPRDGKDADPVAVADMVREQFTNQLLDLRRSVDAIREEPEFPAIPSLVAKAVEAAMPAPVDVKALVVEAVAALPPAKDGKDGAKGDPGDIGPTGQPGLNGKDGADLFGTLMIDRKGALIHTLSDGSTRDLGIVVGKDVDMNTVEGMIDKATHRALAEAWAAVPEPKDGDPGPQGEPGKSITVDDVAPLIKAAVEEATSAIPDVIKYAVQDQVGKLPAPANGKDADPQLIIHMVSEAVMALPQPQNGKDADPALVQSLVKETVERAVAALPVAKDGQDGADGRDGANGADGKSVTIDDVRPLIEETVTKAVTLIPVKDGADGRDGKDGATLDELRPVIEEAVTKTFATIPVPKDGKDGRDGLDVKDLLVVEGGELVATFADGRTKVLGQFRGKDGADGKDGRDIETETVEKLINDKLAKIQPPEIEREAYLASVTKMIEEAVAKHAPEIEEEFAPDDVAAKVAMAVKMMAERPGTQSAETGSGAQPTINIAMTDNREPPVINMHVDTRRGKEVTKVTKHDGAGRIVEFEKTEVDE